jgi:hypothetical protein
MNKNTKLGVTVGLLLALVVVWNFVANDAAGAFHPKPKKASPAQAHKVAIANIPKTMGPDKAPVTIVVYLNETNSCHTPSVTVLKQVVDTYPNEVRVEVKDTRDPGVQAAASKAKIGCEMGITVNGRNTFRLPGKGVITFSGPIESGKHFAQSDLALVLDRMILEKTGKPAVHAVTAAALVEAATPAGETNPPVAGALPAAQPASTPAR